MTKSEMKCKNTTSYKIIYLPYFSRKRRAFSRKDGPPSISSSASRIGLPTTKDLTGRLSLPTSTIRKHILLTAETQTKITKTRSLLTCRKDKIKNKNEHWLKDPSIESVVSFLKIPLCPMTRAALGACARACSRAVFHSNKSSDVSA